MTDIRTLRKECEKRYKSEPDLCLYLNSLSTHDMVKLLQDNLRRSNT